jgi:alpha-beta hydrolase superfamily lysophospholipase
MKVKGEFVRIFTEDGIELHGLFFEPEKKKNIVILHIHGLAGNFYENRFIDYIAEILTKEGYAFLTVNTRGHDYISDFIKKVDSTLTYVQIGAAHEIFEECIYDIKSWIDFLGQRGYPLTILEGHSTGAIKVAFYLSQTQDKRVKGLILMSPSDDIGLQKELLKEKFEEALIVAKEMIKEGKSEELMPKEFFGYPIDAKTYLNMFGPGTKIGIFNFHDTHARFEELSKIQCPILTFYGTIKEAVVNNEVEKALSIIKRKTISAPRCDVKLIKDAPHNYLNHENEVAKIIRDWVITLET